MKKSNALIKSQNINLLSILAQQQIIKRGLDDINKYTNLSKLITQMLILFKKQKYKQCFTVCKKINKIDSCIPVVNLLYKVSLKRLIK